LAKNLEIHWKAPLEGFAKINWDAIINGNKMKMSIVVIIKDKMSKVLAKLLKLKDYIIAPNVAKATVALRAAKFSSELGSYKVVLEGDALQIV
jgi:hypothetical protein